MCQFGSKCTVDHKPHGGSERRRNIEKISKYNIKFEIQFFRCLLSVFFLPLRWEIRAEYQ